MNLPSTPLKAAKETSLLIFEKLVMRRISAELGYYFGFRFRAGFAHHSLKSPSE